VISLINNAHPAFAQSFFQYIPTANNQITDLGINQRLIVVRAGSRPVIETIMALRTLFHNLKAVYGNYLVFGKRLVNKAGNFWVLTVLKQSVSNQNPN
jgi:hypothetical protein